MSSPNVNVTNNSLNTNKGVNKMAINFAVKKNLTVPILKQRTGAENAIYVIATSKIHQGEKMESSKFDEPAWMMNVYDLIGEQHAQIILSKVQRETLTRACPDHSYLNRAFRMELVAVPDKKYHLCTIDELEIPSDFVMPAANGASETATLQAGEKLDKSTGEIVEAGVQATKAGVLTDSQKAALKK